MSKLIQLYSLATPNGQKVSIALEELGLPYEAHTIDIRNGQQFEKPFIDINPNSKIPAIVDPDGPSGKELKLFESGAILLYLAEKTGKLIPKDPVLRQETIQWLFFQMGGLGPMFGQFGHFYKYGRDKCEHPYPLERYSTETKRILGVLDKHLDSKSFMVGEELTIADLAIFPWINCLDEFYDAKKHLELGAFKNVCRYFEACWARPASQRGKGVCPFPD